MSGFNIFPQRIVCLTEEPVEWLYLLGEEDRIAGVSCYVKRPTHRKKHPITSAFTDANLKKISDMKPDLVIGHSDIQKDIARNLVERGLNVFIANHRSLEETLNYLEFLGRMVGKEELAREKVKSYKMKMKSFSERARELKCSPKIYLEEWNEPMICGIRYFSEVFRTVGATDIFADISDKGVLAKDRFVDWTRVCELRPDLFLGCWCGKALDKESVRQRSQVGENILKNGEDIIELPPEIFLQPGPALFEEGLDLAYHIVEGWTKR